MQRQHGSRTGVYFGLNFREVRQAILVHIVENHFRSARGNWLYGRRTDISGDQNALAGQDIQGFEAVKNRVPRPEEQVPAGRLSEARQMVKLRTPRQESPGETVLLGHQETMRIGTHTQRVTRIARRFRGATPELPRKWGRKGRGGSPRVPPGGESSALGRLAPKPPAASDDSKNQADWRRGHT